MSRFVQITEGRTNYIFVYVCGGGVLSFPFSNETIQYSQKKRK